MGIHLMPPLYEIVLKGNEKQVILDAIDGGQPVGVAYRDGPDFATVHGAASGTALSADNLISSVNVGFYTLGRGALRFAVPSSLANKVLVRVRFKFYATADYIDDELVVLAGAALSFPMVLASYGAIGQLTTERGSILPAAVTPNATNYIDLSGNGLPDIVPGANVQYGLRGRGSDLNNVAPTGYRQYEFSVNLAQLEITYQEPS